MAGKGRRHGQATGTNSSTMNVVSESGPLRCVTCGWYCVCDYRDWNKPELGLVVRCPNAACAHHGKNYEYPTLVLKEAK
jgi:hypothetical protein